MKIPGVEITDGVFIGIQDYITALENPLPVEPKKGSKRSYSFGSDIDQNLPEADRVATSQESFSQKLSPSSKSEIFLPSSQHKQPKAKSSFEENRSTSINPCYSELTPPQEA